MAELYCRTDRSGSLLGNVSNGDLVAISHTPSYHSSGQRPGTEAEIGRWNEGLKKINKSSFTKLHALPSFASFLGQIFHAFKHRHSTHVIHVPNLVSMFR